ncbi:hypothetical protein TIFTF001_023021 [Ficus carica]|uniref:Uncharacterized protein n=1 Tax=Ficus carica TaxID=3494 RepID=A0AA88AIV0_FICCA|nr:hypothetical protein TIFTF001_023021 [Ficus carica]
MTVKRLQNAVTRRQGMAKRLQTRSGDKGDGEKA